MMSFFRTLAKSKILGAIIAVLFVAGLLFTGNVRADLGAMLSRDAVITAGSRVYTSSEFKREFDAYRRQSEQQGQPITVQDAVAQGLDQRMLAAFAERESAAELLRRSGVIPSDRLVVDQIAKIKAFFDPISGKFDQKTYADRLSQNGLTPVIFEKGLRDEVAYSHFQAAAAAGAKMPRLYGALISDFEFEVHNLSVFALDPKTLGAPPAPTDAELEPILKANAAALTEPESRNLTLVRFSAQALAPTLTADPAEVKKRYDFRKDTLSAPETRSLIQIPAKSAQDAAALAAKLAQGADPKALATASGVDPVVYDNTPKSAVADPKVADVVFGLAEGKSSGAIQGQLGWAVAKVTKITPGHPVSLEEARPKIEAEVKSEAAADKVYGLVQKYGDAHDKGSNLIEAARAAGVPAISMGAVTAAGADADGKPLGLSARLLKEAFALPQGGETDAVQESKGEYFAVHVDKVNPPAVPPLAKVRDRLAKFYVQTEMNKRLTTKLDGLTARVKKGETLEAVASSVGSQVSHLTITRAQAQQNRSLSPEQLNQIFQAKKGAVITAGAVVARVDSITPPPGPIASATIPTGQTQLGRPIFEELNQEGRAFARTALKPKINLTLARQAIGVDPGAGQAPTPAK